MSESNNNKLPVKQSAVVGELIPPSLLGLSPLDLNVLRDLKEVAMEAIKLEFERIKTMQETQLEIERLRAQAVVNEAKGQADERAHELIMADKRAMLEAQEAELAQKSQAQAAELAQKSQAQQIEGEFRIQADLHSKATWLGALVAVLFTALTMAALYLKETATLVEAGKGLVVLVSVITAVYSIKNKPKPSA